MCHKCRKKPASHVIQHKDDDSFHYPLCPECLKDATSKGVLFSLFYVVYPMTRYVAGVPFRSVKGRWVRVT